MLKVVLPSNEYDVLTGLGHPFGLFLTILIYSGLIGLALAAILLFTVRHKNVKNQIGKISQKKEDLTPPIPYKLSLHPSCSSSIPWVGFCNRNTSAPPRLISPATHLPTATWSAISAGTGYQSLPAVLVKPATPGQIDFLDQLLP